MKKIKLKPEFFYYIAIFLFAIKSWFFFSKIIEVPSVVEQIFKIFILLFFMLKVIYSKISKRKLLISILIFSIMFIIANINNFINLFFTFLAIICAKDVSVKKSIKVLLFVNLCMLIIHLIYFGFQFFTNRYGVDYILYNGIQKRYYCFMRHPNYVAAIMFWTLCQYICINIEKQKSNILISIIVTILCFELTKSRTTMLIFIILLLYLMFRDNVSEKFLKRTFYIILFGGMFLTFFLVFNFNTSNEVLSVFIKNIDTVLSHRITYSYEAIELYPLTFLGNKIDVETAWYGSRLMIDSFYISCLVEYGVCLLVIFIFASCKIIKRLSKDEKFFFILITIVALTERYIFYVSLCFPLLYLIKLYDTNKNLIRKRGRQ